MTASIWSPGGTTYVPALPAVAPISVMPGTLANPGVYFFGDSNTGLYSSGDGYVQLVSNGAIALTIAPDGTVTFAKKAIEAPELTVAVATTTDIGAVLSNSVLATGAGTITSFGTNYRGPMFVRFDSAVTLTYNASTLLTPGAANLSIPAGGMIIVVPKATAGIHDGWQVVSVSTVVPTLTLPQAAWGTATTGQMSRLTASVTLNVGLTPDHVFPFYNVDYIPLTLTQGSGLVLRKAGTTYNGNITIQGFGMGSIYVVSATEYVISGAGVV